MDVRELCTVHDMSISGGEDHVKLRITSRLASLVKSDRPGIGFERHSSADAADMDTTCIRGNLEIRTIWQGNRKIYSGHVKEVLRPRLIDRHRKCVVCAVQAFLHLGSVDVANETGIAGC